MAGNKYLSLNLNAIKQISIEYILKRNTAIKMVKKHPDHNDSKNTHENKKNEKIKKTRGRPKNDNHDQSVQGIHEGDNFQNIDTAIIQFFTSINQTNLVFQQLTREQLQKLYPEKRINKAPEYDTKEESKKIDSYIARLQIVKDLQMKGIKDNEIVQQLKNFFQEASKFFASEVTPELYTLISKTCDIVFENMNNKEKIISQLRKFGDSIPSPEMQNQYFYFGFHMFKLPKHKKQTDIPNMRKHYPHYKYVLLQKFRQPGGPYADFIQKIGQYVFEIIKGA